ncbi:MAG: hypothetical protein V3T26_05895 [candidate division NC10 bacterium]
MSDHPTDVEVQRIIVLAKASVESWGPAIVLDLARGLLAAREKNAELKATIADITENMTARESTRGGGLD